MSTIIPISPLAYSYHYHAIHIGYILQVTLRAHRYYYYYDDYHTAVTWLSHTYHFLLIFYHHLRHPHSHAAGHLNLNLMMIIPAYPAHKIRSHYLILDI